MVEIYRILSRLGRVWSSSTITRLMRFSQPKGAEIRRRPYTVYIGDGYKIRHYRGEVLITLVLTLAVKPLAVIYIVIYIYSKYLKVKYFIS